MNNDLCSIISNIFAYKTNVTKMEEGRLTDCIDMRYHTKGLIEDNSNIACTGGAGYSVVTYINKDSGGRGRKEEDITRTSDLSLFNFSLLESIHVSMSRTQLTNLALLRFISETDDVLNVIYS